MPIIVATVRVSIRITVCIGKMLMLNMSGLPLLISWIIIVAGIQLR